MDSIMNNKQWNLFMNSPGLALMELLKNIPSLSLFKLNSLMTQHFNHPVFLDFVPNHKQLQENNYTYWVNLYINRKS